MFKCLKFVWALCKGFMFDHFFKFLQVKSSSARSGDTLGVVLIVTHDVRTARVFN